MKSSRLLIINKQKKKTDWRTSCYKRYSHTPSRLLDFTFTPVGARRYPVRSRLSRPSRWARALFCHLSLPPSLWSRERSPQNKEIFTALNYQITLRHRTNPKNPISPRSNSRHLGPPLKKQSAAKGNGELKKNAVGRHCSPCSWVVTFNGSAQ